MPTMKTSFRRRLVSPFNFLLFFGLCIIAVAGLALPAVHSSSPTSGETSADNRAGSRFFGAARVPGYGNWVPGIAPAALAGETIEIFAADCTTAKTAFAAGETICAKTDGVDLTVPGNYYVNWFHPNSSETNGGTITTNPQYTLFSIPTSGSYLGTWKANIGRVTPAEGSIIGNPPLFTVSAAQTIATFAYALGACTNTPKTNFVVGETVCARTAGVDPQFNRRFAWVDANGITREFTPITTDPATDDYLLLPTETSLGTWQANVVSSRGSTVVGTPFTVAGLTPSVDLSIAKGLNSGQLKSGEPATFTIAVYNRGPNDAQNVVITDQTPANMTFVAPATQTEGSGFTCTGTTTVTCTGAVMKAGERAVFEFVYTPGAAGQTVTNTATVDSDTEETNTEDNSATAGPYTISPGNGSGGDTCTVACRNDIETPSNTTDGSGNPGAIVHFSPPSGNEECGTITVDHCNDCFFPEGDTVVTATASTGESCSFTVRITPAGSHVTISCPGNHTGNANADCEAFFNVGTASASGTNVTVVGYRSDGVPMYTCDKFGNCTRNSTDAGFNVGVTTITWYAYAHDVPGPYTGPVDSEGDPVNPADTEEGHRNGSATCTQTVTVNDVTPPTIAATNTTVPADANCQGTVPDFSNTVSDNCACTASDDSERCNENNDIAYSQNPAAGTVLPPGTYTVHIEANDGTNNATKDITLTIADQTPPTITCPANKTVNTEPGTCAAHVVTGTATATDNCDSTPTITGTRSDGRPLTDTYPGGTTTITWRATDDAGNYSECTQTITVEDHENPVIVCPAPIVQGNDPGTCSATVNPGQPTATDNCDSSLTITSTRSDGQAMNAPYPKGTTTITWRATDDSGNYKECTQTVTVVDNEKPTFTFTAMQSLWPPNHKYHTFTTANLVASVHDNCDGNIPVSSVVITKVTSDEIENGNGDGNTLNDIVIAANCKSVQLRSEREGNSNGRVYTIFFSVTDAAGNKGTGTTKVVVPHNPGETAVDSGPHYTVTSNCP